jgi:hypothetical protein
LAASLRGRTIRDYVLIVRDDRSPAPSVRLAQAASERLALQLGERIFRQSPHHVGVEVWWKETRLFVIGKPISDGGEQGA